MKKFKQILILAFIIINTFLLINCESEPINGQETEYVYNFDEVNFNNIDLENSLKSKSSSKSEEKLVLRTKLITNLKIPNNLIEEKNTEEFKKFLIENEDNIKGEIIFYINDEINKTFDLAEKSISKPLTMAKRQSDEYPRRNECSYEGVRQCTQYAIYEQMNTFKKLVCAYEGLGCIGMEAASCISRNCLGDGDEDEDED